MAPPVPLRSKWNLYKSFREKLHKHMATCGIQHKTSIVGQCTRDLFSFFVNPHFFFLSEPLCQLYRHVTMLSCWWFPVVIFWSNGWNKTVQESMYTESDLKKCVAAKTLFICWLFVVVDLKKVFAILFADFNRYMAGLMAGLILIGRYLEKPVPLKPQWNKFCLLKMCP